MTKKNPTPKYTPEFRERGVRLYRDQRPDYASDNAAYQAIVNQTGFIGEVLVSYSAAMLSVMRLS